MTITIRPKLTPEERQANKEKWRTELNIIKTTFRNKWIYRIFLDWGTPVNDGLVPLHSGITSKSVCSYTT